MALLRRTDPAQPADITHVTQEMYKKNLELADRNKTLALLRKIDEVVLGSAANPQNLAQQVANTVLTETDFKFAAIFIRNGAYLKPFAVASANNGTALEKAIDDLLLREVSIRQPEHPMNASVKTNQIGSYNLSQFLSQHLPAGEGEKISHFMGLESLFVCPLMVRERSLGVLLIGSPQPLDQISEFKRNLVTRLAGVVAIALDSSLLYQELQLANQHLLELDKAKDDFISMASHQLRTPLTTVKGYLSMLGTGDAGQVNLEQKEFIQNALTGSDRLGKMIIELLNVSRMSTGKFKIDPKLVDLSKIVNDEVKQLQLHADAKHLKLIVNVPKAPVWCEIDEDKTRQVIMNYLDNAIYYTKAGSVTANLSADPKKLIFTVVDTGIGVPKAAIPKLFSKFYRADNAKVARPDGTGLGLYLAKKVIEDQGGKLLFSTVEGKGSTFGFELPVKVKAADNA